MFNFKTKPFKHQEVAFEMSKDKEYFAYLMEMGTGKTKVTIDCIGYLASAGKIKGAIIVAPKSLCRNWAHKEIPTHMSDDVDHNVVLQGSKDEFADDKFNILVINVESVYTDKGYDAIDEFIKKYKDVLIAVDESTTIKNPSAQRTKIMLKFGRKVKFRRILTGTLIANTPMDAYSQCDFLKSGILGNSFFTFRARYATMVKRFINGRSFNEITGFQRLDELKDRIGQFSYRVLKKDCLDLPEKIYVERFVEMTTEQKRIYKEIVEESLAMVRNNEFMSAQLALTQILRMRQIICNLATTEDGNVIWISKTDNRMNELLNILREAGEQKVLIWCSFIPVILKLEEEIGKEFGKDKVASYHGEKSDKERQEIVDKMQNQDDALQFCILQNKTGGFGLTITSATIAVYYDHDWSLMVRQQSEDRNHRIGQKQSVTYIDLVCGASVEKKIRSGLLDKSKLAAKINGDLLREILTD